MSGIDHEPHWVPTQAEIEEFVQDFDALQRTWLWRAITRRIPFERQVVWLYVHAQGRSHTYLGEGMARLADTLDKLGLWLNRHDLTRLR